jgi:two-component system, NarL family, nitrate/nitrite response regulator NarL
VALRCLIVDDNPLFLEGATALLEREGIEVVGVASNPAEALRLVIELSPDVTLVDVDLGDEDGFELAQTLDGRSKVILISTHSETDLGQLIQASPALGFLSKHQLSARAITDLLQRAEGS